jgi:nucleotidyltransferase/DNA polymerase involved in DNA repair
MVNQVRTPTIFLVDMQSFYASVEKSHYPEFKDQPVVVAGDPSRRSGIILAACPLAKSFGVTTAETLGEALGKCPTLVILRPHMQRYIDVSLQITEIMFRFTDLVEPYSIDEQFMDVSGSLALFGDAYSLAKQLQHQIQEETDVYARVGMGPNKVLAKMACDMFAKKNTNGIFHLHPGNLQETAWPMPVEKMFGVGRRMRRHFERLGIHTIGDLAQYPLDKLQQIWGVPAHVLWMSANGIDYSPVKPHTHATQKAVGHNMTLPRDYTTAEEVKVVIRELSEEVCRRARSKGLIGQTASLGCRGADFEHPTGFYRQLKLAYPTNHGKALFDATWQLFQTFWDGEPVRSVGVTLNQLRADDTIQLDLFHDVVRERNLNDAIDAIKSKYGTAAIIRSSSLTEAGQAYARAHKIGGHMK